MPGIEPRIPYVNHERHNPRRVAHPSALATQWHEYGDGLASSSGGDGQGIFAKKAATPFTRAWLETTRRSATIDIPWSYGAVG